MSHVISWPNRGGHGFCLRTVFLLGRHPFLGVAAEEMYISWFGKYAQNSLFSSRSVIARRKPVRDAIFFFRFHPSKRRPEAASTCTLYGRCSLSLWHMIGVEGKEGQSTALATFTAPPTAVLWFTEKMHCRLPVQPECSWGTQVQEVAFPSFS